MEQLKELMGIQWQVKGKTVKLWPFLATEQVAVALMVWDVFFR